MNQPQNETCYLKSDHISIPNMRRFSHEAMATTFQVVIVEEDGRYAQQAARAAFDELDRLEAELSRFIENSDISRINKLAANQPLTIGPAAFECLQHSIKIKSETNGIFDVTIGGRFSKSTAEKSIKLDESQHTVELAGPVQIDLGGIGKGYAVDKMAEVLREWSIDTGLISGGYSSVLALDAPDNTNGWPVTLSHPNNHKQILARLNLQNRALGASGLQKGLHIIDPRTGHPAKGKIAAWACADDASTSDALSTAFMVMSPDEIELYCKRHPDTLAMVVIREEKVLRFGKWKNLKQA